MNINITIDGVAHAAIPLATAAASSPAASNAEQELKVLFEAARKMIRVSEEGSASARDRNGLRRALKGVKAQFPEGTFPADCA